MLVLFDIDGTLLLSEGAGARAMIEAVRELSGADVDLQGLEFAGRLDPQIWADIAARNGLDATRQQEDLRSTYTSLLKKRLGQYPTAYALPGVNELLRQLDASGSLTMGILSGNFPETGRLKLEAAGIDPGRFLVGAWGSDGTVRRDLPPVAMKRYSEQTGTEIEPRHVVIIGDTPHDIDCARANGCLVIAVATGSFSLQELSSHGPDLALMDLSDTNTIWDWIQGLGD